MLVAHAPRAVVFALEELPPGDRQHILEVAQYLNLPQDAASWRAPLVLTRESARPLAPGLSSDVDLAIGGPSLLLLAMRLLLADAWSWPEQRFLVEGGGPAGGYALYAADPARWTADSLSQALTSGSRTEVHRGLLPRPARPWSPADRVPVLGWQVPVLGRPDPVRQMHDLRPAEARQYRFGGLALPIGVTPGTFTDRHRLFFRMLEARHEGDGAEVLLEVLRADGARGCIEGEWLRLRLRDLSGLGDAGEDGEALAELLREALPSCIFCCPQGGLLLFDLHRFDLELVGRDSGRLGPIGRATLPPRERLPEEEGAAPLDPCLWEPGTLSSLLQIEESYLSARGRLAALRYAGQRDGAAIDAWLLLDTAPASGSRPLLWQSELFGPAPALAISDDQALVAIHGAAALSPSCLAEEQSESEDSVVEWLDAHRADLVVFGVPAGGAEHDRLAILSTLPLPAPLLSTMDLTLVFVPGTRTLLCHQAVGDILCAIDLDYPERPWLRRARADDLLALLCTDGSGLTRMLRASADRDGDLGAEDLPRLDWLAPAIRAGLAPRYATELLDLSPEQAARALLRFALASLRTCDGDEIGPLLD